MSLGIFKKGKGVFGNGANNPVEPEDIYLLKMPTSTADLINNGEDRQHPFITANDIVGGNGTAIISGDIITWLRGYTYNVPPYTYLIRGTAYETQAVEIPLDPANADPNLDRIDVIVATFDAEGNGVIGVIKGQESAVAVKPTINYDTQIELTFIPVDGNTTQPASVINLVVYDENVEFATSDNTTGRVDFEFTTSPFSSTLCLAVTDFINGDEIKFTSPTPFAPFNFGGLQFQIQPTSGVWEDYGTFKIGFFNADVLNGTWVTIDSSLTNLAGNPYAFNSASATWQNIGIGISSFGLSVNTADNIRFVKTDNASAESFKLDLIRMQAGIVVSAKTFIKTKLSQFINDGNGDINFPFITADDIPVVGQSVAYKEIPIGAVDGVNNVFTIANDAVSKEWIWVFMDGVGRNEFTYNSVTKQITMDFAPATGTEIYVQYIVNLSEPLSPSIGEAPIDGNSYMRKDADWTMYQRATAESTLIIDGTVLVGKGDVLNIPDAVLSIANSAFYNNNIATVTLGNNVISIGYRAFKSNKIRTLIIPSTVTTIGDEAFFYNQLTSITIPDSVTTIGQYAFGENDLTSVIIGNSVISLSGFNNNQLTSIIIPDSVISIGDLAFSNNQLTSVTIPNSVNSIGQNAFASNLITSVTIPNSVTSIGMNAFSNNQLTSVTIPNSVIYLSGFYNNDLTSVTIPDSVITIGQSAFASNLLTSVTIPNSVTNLEPFAFQYNSLTSVTFGNSVITIGQDAFSNNQLTSITIPNSVTTIGQYTFRTNKLTSVTFGNSVTSIGYYSFTNNLLTSVNVPIGCVVDPTAFDVGVTINYV